MVVLDATIVNIALPSAQRALDFTTADRQWVVTAYALAFGSLLLFGGRLGDLIGRKITFLAGALGFAAASAAGGAAASFDMLVAARAIQGAFGALLAPAALSILSTTFSDPKERGKAFGVYGAIVGAGGAIGLVLGGILTEYLTWRWCLYVNLLFAGLAAMGAVLLLKQHRVRTRPRLDLPGAALVSASMFCLVYGFSSAANHNWHTPSTYGFLAAGVVLLAVFASWQSRTASPLLPPRVVLDRNRGGAYLAVLIVSAGMFGIFLFLTYYMQQTLGYSPVVSGVAFLPLIAMVVVAANLSNVVLPPRVGPKPLVTAGMLLAAGSLVWLTRIGVHSGYASCHAPASRRFPHRAGNRDRRRRQHGLLRRTIRHRRPDRPRQPLLARRDHRCRHVPRRRPAHAAVPDPPVPRRGTARARGDDVRASDARLDPPTVLRHRLPPLVHLHNARRGNHRHNRRRAGSSQLIGRDAPVLTGSATPRGRLCSVVTRRRVIGRCSWRYHWSAVCRGACEDDLSRGESPGRWQSRGLPELGPPVVSPSGGDAAAATVPLS